MLDELFDTLTPYTTIICSNQRLAMALSQRFSVYQQRKNLTGWSGQRILAIQTWIEELWQQLIANQLILPPQILTDYQVQLVWEKIIKASLPDSRLFHSSQTARLALQAWQELHYYNGYLINKLDEHSDTALFKSWAKSYQMQCLQHNWLDQTSRINKIISLLPDSNLTTKQDLIFIGFIEFTPQQQQLLDSLTSAGFCYKHYQSQLSPEVMQIHRIALQDKQQEIATMALWAKQVLAQAPDSVIGCIVPQLAESKAEINQIFSATFVPHYLLNNPISPSMVNISAGLTLNNYPLIHAALAILGLAKPAVTLETITTILRSSFITGAAAAMSARAMLAAKLHSLGEREFAFKDLLNFIAAYAQVKAVNLLPQLQNLDKLIPDNPTRLAPSQWAGLFKLLLTSLGWPGEQTLNSIEHQTKERWNQVLTEFEQLDFLLKKLSVNQAYDHLKNLVQQSKYQPKISQMPVYVLTATEALAMPFTHLWIMGVNETNWPPAANPNPFIPFNLQCQLNIPHATAEQELRFHQVLISRLTETTATTMISYAQTDHQQSLRPSSLIKQFPVITLAELGLVPLESLAASLFLNHPLEIVTDEYAPAIREASAIGGGIAIFKQQAACPFRAFAQFRLRATGIDYPQTGLSSSERGSLVHEALEYFWKKTATHQTLCNYSEQELFSIIKRGVTKAVLTLKKRRPQLLKPRFMQLEINRLIKLINQWLQLEKKRPAFTVTATEQKFQFTLADIGLTIRIDRIDQLMDGSYLLIDYKTGQCSENAWFGTRLDDPQLPFYCMSHELPISGLTFAQLASWQVKFKGIIDVNSQNAAPKTIKPVASWAELNTSWQAAITTLAQQFKQGYAKVDPKTLNKTCQYCDLKALCRINSQDDNILAIRSQQNIK